MTTDGPRPLPTPLAATVTDNNALLPVAISQELGATSLTNQQHLRYTLGDQLGAGTNGRVFAAQDLDLARTVAVKIHSLDAGADDPETFLSEARITASLEHPGVVPVYDVGRTADGAPYFTMKRAGGISLGAALAAAAKGEPAPEAIAGLNARVTVLLKICDALAAAHSRGILHRDIKPDNIMVGEFGEVLIVDWGIATSVHDGTTIGGRNGTPFYMSPEQARGEALTVASDVYSVAATMFEILVGRPPTSAEDEAAFWTKKRMGVIDPPTPAELVHLPRQLLAIAHTGLAALPSDRYASVAALAADLRRWQAGLAISVYRDPPSVRLSRWWRLHLRQMLVTATALIAVTALVAFIYRERLKELASWGAPLLVEEFNDDTWRDRWHVMDGSFERREGRLVSTGGAASILLYPKRLSGAGAIEFVGEIGPDSRPCDLSVVFLPEVTWNADGRVSNPQGRWELKAGANDNAFCTIAAPDNRLTTIHNLRLETGRRYRVRAEIENERLALYVDGQLVCEHHEQMPFNGGWFGILGYYPGKIFDDIRITGKGLPQRVPATAYGDAFVQLGDWNRAAEQYRRVIDSHAGSALAEDARFRLGICLLRAGNFADAVTAWQPLRDGRYGVRTRALLIDARITTNLLDRHHVKLRYMIAQPHAISAPQAATDEIRDLARQARGSDRAIVAGTWARGSQILREFCDSPAVLEQWLDVHDRWLAEFETANQEAARLLLALRRPDEVLRRFPHLRPLCATAMLQQGEFERVLSEFRDQANAQGDALWQLGRYDQLIAFDDPSGDHHFWRYATFGRWDEFAKLPMQTRHRGHRANLLLGLGRPAEVLDDPHAGEFERDKAKLALGDLEGAIAGGHRSTVAAALMISGRSDEVLARWPSDWPLVARARGWLAMDRLAAGDTTALADFAPPCDPFFDFGFDYGRWHHLVVPFILERQRTSGDFEAACRTARDRTAERFARVVWWDARYLLGEVDAATWREQPMRLDLERRLAFLDALRAERAGDRERAADCYQAWLGPHPLANDPLHLRFARWRLAVLAQTD